MPYSRAPATRVNANERQHAEAQAQRSASDDPRRPTTRTMWRGSRAERHADADLVRLTADRQRRDAVHADRAQQQREDREAAGQDAACRGLRQDAFS